MRGFPSEKGQGEGATHHSPPTPSRKPRPRSAPPPPAPRRRRSPAPRAPAPPAQERVGIRLLPAGRRFGRLAAPVSAAAPSSDRAKSQTEKSDGPMTAMAAAAASPSTSGLSRPSRPARCELLERLRRAGSSSASRSAFDGAGRRASAERHLVRGQLVPAALAGREVGGEPPGVGRVLERAAGALGDQGVELVARPWHLLHFLFLRGRAPGAASRRGSS